MTAEVASPTESGSQWHTLGMLPLIPLPTVLIETLGMQDMKRCMWMRSDIQQDFVDLPPIDMTRGMKALAALGRCSVAVALYMAGAIKQNFYTFQMAVRVVRSSGKIVIQARPDAGYFLLLKDAYVVPQYFACRWRLVKQATLMGKPCSDEESAMPPVQHLGVDGEGFMQIEPPAASRPWLPHQRQSFSWMLHRESVCDLFVCESSTRVPTKALNERVAVEWRMDKAFDLRGGILCDPVGSGKTATSLALIAHDPRSGDFNYDIKDAAREIFGDSWLTLNATLILCPDHVHEQWLKEAEKTFCKEDLFVLPIRSVEELRAAAPTLKMMGKDGCSGPPTLVVVAFGVVKDVRYSELISPGNSELKGWLEGHDSWTQGLALDCFAWRRLLIDEVHELVHICDRCQPCPCPCPQMGLLRLLRCIKSERRWGLTGTAQEVLRNADAVQCLAPIFRAEFNSPASASRFIEHYCRTNTVKLQVKMVEHVEYIEHTAYENVIYTQRARDVVALHNEGDDAAGIKPLTNEDLEAVTPLLKICTHFNVGELCGAEGLELEPQMLTASTVAANIYHSKKAIEEAAQSSVDNAMGSEAALMTHEDTKPSSHDQLLDPKLFETKLLWVEPRRSKEGDLHVVITRVEETGASKVNARFGDIVVALGGRPVFELARRLEALSQQLQAEAAAEARPGEDALQVEFRELRVRQRLCEAFQQEALSRAHCGNIRLSWRNMQAAGTAIRNNEVEWVRAQKHLNQEHKTWRDAISSFNFMSTIFNTLRAQDRVHRNCPVCLDDFDAAITGVVLHCGHVYCDRCSKRMFGSCESFKPGTCPICRRAVSNPSHAAALSELATHAATDRKLAATIAQSSPYGSKLHRVAEVLMKILSADTDERAVVFCQFADLETQVSGALRAADVAHVRLSTARDVFEQTEILDSFQRPQGQGSCRVLLLSLEQSASGTNLTIASHVLLIHPMAASTPERAVAFEQQAVGRCVRLGQRRTVKVWRFVTRDTVEETLHRRLELKRRNVNDAATRKRDVPRQEPARRAATEGELVGESNRQGVQRTRPKRAARVSSIPTGSGPEAARALRNRRSRSSSPGARANGTRQDT